MKFCSNCKHYKFHPRYAALTQQYSPFTASLPDPPEHSCYEGTDYDLVTGQRRPKNCKERRYPTRLGGIELDACGPAGNKWEPRQVVVIQK